ncbi:MAG: hypothetical protein ACTTKN_00295 [Phocaeicola sp.]|uniref:hypothetical protein n=1 Tax=Phocaeicola TaxID=909656 RepID=UPI00234E7B8A|nr:hypothetical protein [Phocaeicola oris]MCE2616004.1 hypothetical protein [Phocaeicola oris]
MKKKVFIMLAVLFTSTAVAIAKNVVQVTTSCGKVAYIDTDRTSAENTMKQIMEIDRILCGD